MFKVPRLRKPYRVDVLELLRAASRFEGPFMVTPWLAPLRVPRDRYKCAFSSFTTDLFELGFRVGDVIEVRRAKTGTFTYSRGHRFQEALLAAEKAAQTCASTLGQTSQMENQNV